LIPGIVVGVLLTAHVVLPVFYGLKMSSINEYLVLRFNSPALRYMLLMTACLKELLYLGICLYAPTLALAAVTPISSNTYILIMGIVVTLYSSVGGLKAVVWTDFFQTIIIFLGVLLTTISSLTTAGGISNAMNVASENGRLEAFDMTFGMHERHTATNTFIMGVVTFGYVFSFSQSTLQRITAQASLRNAKAVMYTNAVGVWVILTVIFLGGIGVYAVYHGCDPISLGLIEKKDQILPFYVMHHLGFLKGVPGVFVACLFSGTLSSISSVLNSLPTMLWVDLLAELKYFQRASERSKTIFNKLLSE
ncbi:Sodium/solute symporter, partial [Trinorchestia longiramus]